MAKAQCGFQQVIDRVNLQLTPLDHHLHQTIGTPRLKVLSIQSNAFAMARRQGGRPDKSLLRPHLLRRGIDSIKRSIDKRASANRIQSPIELNLPLGSSKDDGMTRSGGVLCMAMENETTSLLKQSPETEKGTSNAHAEFLRHPSTPEPSEVGTSYQADEEETGQSRPKGSGATWGETQVELAEDGGAVPWFPVEPIWQASEQDALRDEHLRRMLAPAWRVLLLSDGSVTRHLQLLSDFGSVTADCFQMAEIGDDLAGLPPGAELVPGPRVQRQVWLRTSDGQPLVYAASWWSAREVRGYLKEVQKPIWVNLSETRAELYRDVQRLYLGHSDELERVFGAPGPFWSRHYVFYHDGRPLTLIYEVFSRSLEQYIGPMHPADRSRTN